MKTFSHLIFVFLLFGFISCEKEESIEIDKSYLDFFMDKSIRDIQIVGNTKYVYSETECDTCGFHGSGGPTLIPQWTVILPASYESYAAADFLGIPRVDSKGNIYAGKNKLLYKLNKQGEYELILSFDDFYFQDFVFDKLDNIWFYGSHTGIAYWDKTNIEVYNSNNSLLSEGLYSKLAIDNTGKVWICNGPGGLLTIESGTWASLPGSEIPGFYNSSSALDLWVDHENDIWLKVIDDSKTPGITSILRLNNKTWITEFSGWNYYSNIKIDSKGVMWAIIHNSHAFQKDESLKYFRNKEWIDIDISGMPRISTVNADNNYIYIGTISGLFEKPN